MLKEIWYNEFKQSNTYKELNLKENQDECIKLFLFYGKECTLITEEMREKIIEWFNSNPKANK